MKSTHKLEILLVVGLIIIILLAVLMRVCPADAQETKTIVVGEFGLYNNYSLDWQEPVWYIFTLPDGLNPEDSEIYLVRFRLGNGMMPKYGCKVVLQRTDEKTIEWEVISVIF